MNYLLGNKLFKSLELGKGLFISWEMGLRFDKLFTVNWERAYLYNGKMGLDKLFTEKWAI